MSGFPRNEFRPGASVRVAYTAASASGSLPNGGKNRRYRLTATSACYVKWGTGAQTASTAAFNVLLGANESLVVNLGVADTIAAIRDSADGSLVATEIVPE